MSFLARLFSSAAERAFEGRLRQFREEVLAARAASDEAALTALRARPAALGLTEDDVALELEMVDGLLEVIEMRKGTPGGGGRLPEIVTNHRALAGEACRFAAPASRPDVVGDPGGKLFFTDCRIVYLGSPALTISWAHVAEVREVERDLLIRVRPDATRTFRCNSYGDTLRGAYIASVLIASVRHTSV